MSLGTFPVGDTTVSGMTVTVDQWLKKPELITRRVADITQKRLIAGSVFDTSSINAPAVVTEVPNVVDNDLFTTTDAEPVEPLTQIPRANVTRGSLAVFKPEKWAHAVDVSTESIEDNDAEVMKRAPTQLANTLIRKIDIRAVATLATAVSTYSRTQAASTTWAALNALTYDTKTNASTALHVFGLADKKLAEEERGFDGGVYDTLLLNPQENLSLGLAIGVKSYKQVLADTYGIKNILVSPRVTAGTAFYLASGQVGAMRFNRPLNTKVKEDEDIDGRTIYCSARFIPYVNEPYAVLQLTNLA